MEFYLIYVTIYVLINVLATYIFSHYIDDDYEPYSTENLYSLSDYLIMLNIIILVICKLFEEQVIPYIKNKLKYFK